MPALFRHADPESTLVWHHGQAISRASFTWAARQLAARLPSATHAINLCNGRLAFLLGFVAAGLREQITLLPHNQSSSALQALQTQHPAHHVVDDSCLDGLELQHRTFLDLQLPDHIPAAVLFTSGSTGAAQPQSKRWQTLLRTGELDAARFLTQPGITLVATVPSQHMFGLQTTVLLPLASDCAIADARPFYPADVRQALQTAPAPRALITTPTHLRTCIAAGIAPPPIKFVLSATAPLSAELARQVETQWHTEVLEIYGSTEAGTMATRRTSAGAEWQLQDDAQLQQHDGHTTFLAAHLPEPVPLNDHLEIIAPGHFRLLGRDSEYIKIAGKRASLGDLTAALLCVPGVIDGVVFLPEGRSRTAALAVAPALQTAEILDHMSHRVDPVFLPRPLVLLQRLPRNAVGKLSAAALATALQAGESP